MSNYPPLVTCTHKPFPGFPCSGQGTHADCRDKFWQRYAAQVAREEARGIPVPAKSRRRCPA